MWSEVVLANAAPVVGAVSDFIERLEAFRSALSSRDEAAIHEFFASPASALAEFLPDRS